MPIPFPGTFCALLSQRGRAPIELPQNAKGPNAVTSEPLAFDTYLAVALAPCSCRDSGLFGANIGIGSLGQAWR